MRRESRAWMKWSENAPGSDDFYFFYDICFFCHKIKMLQFVVPFLYIDTINVLRHIGSRYSTPRRTRATWRICGQYGLVYVGPLFAAIVNVLNCFRICIIVSSLCCVLYIYLFNITYSWHMYANPGGSVTTIYEVVKIYVILKL